MHINKEAIIATSYIGKEGNENNRCYLSKESLFVRYKGKLEKFDLQEISDIRFKHKLFLMPIVVGGIIAPLCLLALVKAIGNPWLVLSGLVAGLLFIYYGYEGSPTLSILTRVKEYDFFIKKTTPNLLAFTKYARQIFKFGESGALFYLNLSAEDLLQLQDSGKIKIADHTPLLYYDEALRSQKPLQAIDVMQSHIRFQLIPKEGRLIPTISGTISKEDILHPDR